eukprot:scaffold165444_cov19-Tisochrysis_lutea.AAC.1
MEARPRVRTGESCSLSVPPRASVLKQNEGRLCQARPVRPAGCFQVFQAAQALPCSVSGQGGLT